MICIVKNEHGKRAGITRCSKQCLQLQARLQCWDCSRL